MGCSRFFKERIRDPDLRLSADRGFQIPGIRKWPEAYLPKIYDRTRVDRVIEVSQATPRR